MTNREKFERLLAEFKEALTNSDRSFIERVYLLTEIATLGRTVFECNDLELSKSITYVLGELQPFEGDIEIVPQTAKTVEIGVEASCLLRYGSTRKVVIRTKNLDNLVAIINRKGRSFYERAVNIRCAFSRSTNGAFQIIFLSEQPQKKIILRNDARVSIRSKKKL
jgi:hypothetical protein